MNAQAQERESMDVIDVVLNRLLFDTLNQVPWMPPKNAEEALDYVGSMIKVAGAGVTVALVQVADGLRDIAEAIRERAVD